jgi:hypothetical protein
MKNRSRAGGVAVAALWMCVSYDSAAHPQPATPEPDTIRKGAVVTNRASERLT